MKNNSILVIGVVAVIIFVIYRGNQKKKVKPVENATQEVDEDGEPISNGGSVSGGGGGGGGFGGDVRETTTLPTTTPTIITLPTTTPTTAPATTTAPAITTAPAMTTSPNITIAPATTTSPNITLKPLIKPNITLKPLIKPALTQNAFSTSTPTIKPPVSSIKPPKPSPFSALDGKNSYEIDLVNDL